MSNCHSTNLSCGSVNAWNSCGCGTCSSCNTCGTCNTCGSVAGSSTPACNPWAPWGRNGNCGNGCQCGRCRGCGWNNSCGTVLSDGGTGCSTCGRWGCDGQCGRCGGWNQCGSCDGCGGSTGWLVPRAVSVGRTFQRRITQTLCVEDLPEIAEGPFTLVSVAVSGQATWEQIAECRQQLLRVTVPVVVQVRDCSGRCRTGHSTVTLTIPLCSCAPQDFWRGQLYVAPCIRLVAPVTEDEDACFEATLEVQAEVYLVRLQVVDD